MQRNSTQHVIDRFKEKYQQAIHMKKEINLKLALKPLFWVYVAISSAFKHDCWMNKKMVSYSYFKDGDGGVIFSTGKEYCCEKCGKRWSE